MTLKYCQKARQFMFQMTSNYSRVPFKYMFERTINNDRAERPFDVRDGIKLQDSGARGNILRKNRHDALSEKLALSVDKNVAQQKSA